MNTRVTIDLEGPQDLREDLVRLDPEARLSRAGFISRLYYDDSRVEKMLARLSEAGYRAWSGRGTRDLTCEYKFTFTREYDESDFDAAEYLEIAPYILDNTIPASGRDEEGCLRLHRRGVRIDADFARVPANEGILVPQRNKHTLEQANLRALSFYPTITIKGTGLAEECLIPLTWIQAGVAPWWEIYSKVILPPLSPSMTLMDRQGNPLPPGSESVYYRAKEDIYNHAELHYCRSDLAESEPFDIALTFENFGTRRCTVRRTIVSKRFYQVCTEHGLECDWVPVRIDEE